MSIDDRVGEWMLRYVIGPILFRLARTFGGDFRTATPPKDLYTDHPYRVVALRGVKVGAYPDTIEVGQTVWLKYDEAHGLLNEGSIVRLPDNYDGPVRTRP